MGEKFMSQSFHFNTLILDDLSIVQSNDIATFKGASHIYKSHQIKNNLMTTTNNAFEKFIISKRDINCPSHVSKCRYKVALHYYVTERRFSFVVTERNKKKKPKTSSVHSY